MKLDKNQIYIIENFINQKEQDEILKNLVYKALPNIYYFTKTFYDQKYPPNIVPEDQWVNSTQDKNFLLRTIENKFSVEIDEVLRVKTNWCFRKDKSHKNSMYIPHTDDHNAWVLIYYVLDSDGDTLLFDQTTLDLPAGVVLPKNLNKLTVKTSISPQKGKAMLFWGNRFHVGKPPIENDYRILINHNFTIKE